MTDSIEYLRKLATDIRKHMRVIPDADKLDAIAEEIGDLRAGLRVDPDLATAAYMAGSRYWRKRAEKAETALKAATEWRPMETAPKDGSLLLAIDGDDGGGIFNGVVLIRWDNEEDYDHEEYPPGWQVLELGTGDELGGCNLTGWLPLPDVGGKAELAALKGGAE